MKLNNSIIICSCTFRLLSLLKPVKINALPLSLGEMVFCNQNCSDLYCEKNCSGVRERLLKFEAEGREFAKILRSLEQFIQTVKGQNNFW